MPRAPRFIVFLLLAVAVLRQAQDERSAGAIGRDELPGLLHQLVAGKPAESNHAIDRLRYLGPEIAGPPLRSLLASMNEGDREAASSALVVVHDRGAIGMLERSLLDEDWLVRRNAVQALGALRAAHARRRIERLLRDDPKPRVRLACISVLPALGGASAALAAASAHDTMLEVRLAALDALAHAMDRGVGPLLRPLLEDSSMLVRFAAARSLAWAGDPAARQFLTGAIDSPDSDEARRAVTALSDVPSRWAVGLLWHAVESKDESAACRAAVALVHRQDSRGRPALERLATSGGPGQACAQDELSRLGPPAAPPQPGGSP